MRIGELANKAKVNIQTVRFYERQRLLREPARTPSGYRNYDQADLENVLFIKWCQRLGFTLKEVKELLQLHAALVRLPSARVGRKPNELRSIIRVAERKLADIQEKVESLRTMGKQLATAVRQLQGQPEPACPASKPEAISPRHRRSTIRRFRKSP
jgi:MerR family mercuric resistance operon transcriptional regulator